MREVTQILSAIEKGDPSAAEQLLPAVYSQLRELASAKLKHEKPGQTLQATALVHEAYLRLVGGDSNWNNRAHFFGAAAEAMRRILVEQARRKKAVKHAGSLRKQSVDGLEIEAPAPTVDLLAINEVLERFEQMDGEAACLVKLRYFSGFTIPQAAEAMEISVATANRYWAYARAWLHTELKSLSID